MSDGIEAIKKWREEGGEITPTRNPLERWQDNDTRKTSIDAFCFQCMGGGSGYRVLIRECTSGPKSQAPCPLWNWRPYK